MAGDPFSKKTKLPSSFLLFYNFPVFDILTVRKMNKLLEYGRKVMFLVRVLSGYEERRIRAYRLQLQERIENAQAKKAELRKIPEQAILSEVCRLVEEMQALNRKLEETEVAIEDYLMPIDKNAHIIMNMQMDKEEKHMKEMIKAMQEQAGSASQRDGTEGSST